MLDDGLIAPARSPRARPSSRILYLAVAFTIAGILLYFSLRGIQWKQVWTIVSHAKLQYVALWFAMGSFALVLRALRWRILLRSQAPVDVPTAFWATAGGYFGNFFLPARAGELVRTMMVSARSGLSKTFVLTTALSERLSDAVTLVVIASIVLLTLPVRPGWLAHAARPFAVIGLIGAAMIAFLPPLERVWGRLLQRSRLPEAFRDKLSGILAQILIGIRTFHDGGRLLRFFSMSALIWLTDAIGTVVGAHSVGLGINLPIAFLLITGLGLGSALPSTPGYVGIYQFVAVSVLTPFGFSRNDAIAYILLSQALQYVGVAMWGVPALTRTRGLNFRALKVPA